MNYPTLELKRNSTKFTGHTVSYTKMNKLLNDFNINRKCKQGDTIFVYTLQGDVLKFNLNAGNKARLGKLSGGYKFKFNDVIHIRNIEYYES
jgi:hypothetical protein